MSEAPAELWVSPGEGEYAGLWVEDGPGEADEVRYVRADLYEALLARAQQDCLQWLGELGTDYPR